MKYFDFGDGRDGSLEVQGPWCPVRTLQLKELVVRAAAPLETPQGFRVYCCESTVFKFPEWEAVTKPGGWE